VERASHSGHATYSTKCVCPLQYWHRSNKSHSMRGYIVWARVHQEKLVTATQPQISENCYQTELNWVAQTEEMATRLQRNSWKSKKLNSQATEKNSFLTDELRHSFLVPAVLPCFCDSFVSSDVSKAANFVFVQLTEQKPGICDKSRSDYARRNKIYLAWETFSHEMKKSGSWFKFLRINMRTLI
jgi:hypothetical protein